MPLNLYIKKEDVNKTGLKLEERNDAFFNLHIGTTKISDTIKSLILNIDHSTYSSGSDIKQNMVDLWTSEKLVLAVKQQ